jgi:hypothetical protein
MVSEEKTGFNWMFVIYSIVYRLEHDSAYMYSIMCTCMVYIIIYVTDVSALLTAHVLEYPGLILLYIFPLFNRI